MFRPLYDSEYIFGLHEPGGEELMLSAERPGWVLFTEAVGHNPNNRTSVDFTPYSSRGLGVICRINNGYVPEGTIPHSSQYQKFARRVSNFVAASRGCKIWIIGNEMNYVVERPDIQIDWFRHDKGRGEGVDHADPLRRSLPVRFNALPDYSTEIRTTRSAIISPGESITPDLYARCYRLCRDAIHRLPGHADDQVLIGAVVPWNTQTMYAGNPNGDWVQYFRDILEMLGPDGCDGFTLHTYTHGADPGLITSEVKLTTPFKEHHSEFRAYMDFMEAVPASMRHLPAYITETDQSGPWEDVDSGWVRRAYSEINRWNRQSSKQQIRALLLYHWPYIDRWRIDGKEGVVNDFQRALKKDYYWRGGRERSVYAATPVAPPKPQRPPYQVAWLDDIFPPKLTAGERIVVPITVRNTGGMTWHRGGDAPFRIGYRYFHNRQPYLLRPDQMLHTELLEDVPADRTVTVDTYIMLPEAPGDYMLEIDLVHEGITWFKDQGGTVLTRWVTVDAMAALPPADRTAEVAVATETVAAVEPERDIKTDVTPDVVVEAKTGVGVEAGIEAGIDAKVETEGQVEAAAQVEERLAQARVPQNGWYLGVEGDEKEVEDEDEANLPVPLFNDVSTSLPQAGAGYARRNLNDVQYLVINHTATHPLLNLERIAQVHVQQGYAGIAYHFMVDHSGQVLKVSNLEDVVLPDQLWSSQGVNICLAGNFRAEAPTLPQLESTVRLCAWLARNLGLSTDAIVGLGELSQTDSPGQTFYQGLCWKSTLTRLVKLQMAVFSATASAGSNERVQELNAKIQKVQAENAALVKKNSELQNEQERLSLINQQIPNLEKEVEALQAQLAVQTQELDGAVRVQLMSEQLPREAHRYIERSVQNVHYIVINHTGAMAEPDLKQIAEAHMPDWPGILYDYVIDQKGAIYQTQPLDQVANTEQPYIAQAINVAFAGDFNGTVPTEKQLQVGGRLVAWLMQRFPEVGHEQIKGLREFIDHPSPGQQWTAGKKWKEMLLASVRSERLLVEPDEMEIALRSQLAEQERKVHLVEQNNHELQDQNRFLQVEMQRLQSQIQALESQAEAQQAISSNFIIPKPAFRFLAEQLPKHPSLRYGTRALNRITHIAIHHTAAPPTMGPSRIVELHINEDPNRGKKAWPGIGYHFFIHADGTIDQTNYLETVGYHVYNHNSYSLGVVFAGSFMNGKIPTSAQLRAGAHLAAWLMQELQIPLARVWGHREFPDNTTICPGSEWMLGNRWRNLLFEQIEQIQNGIGIKQIRHYLLFWQRPYPGPLARQEFASAIDYISRFRPAIGFDVEDAKNAEYVTIVGGESGISLADEHLLRNSGCKIERVAGRNEEESSRLLAELAHSGRRFRGFDVDF